MCKVVRSRRARLIRASACVVASIISTAETDAAVVFRTGTAGPDGQTSGASVNSNTFVGVRFQLFSPTTVNRMGGSFAAASFQPQTIFGALVQLSGASDFPDSTDLSTSDVRATTTLNAPVGSQEITGSFGNYMTLSSGWYALVYGSGHFGASGLGIATQNNPNNGPQSYFFRDGAGPWSNSAAAPYNFFLAGPTSCHWNKVNGGDWNTSTNWNGGTIPDAPDDATFDTGEGGATYDVWVSADSALHDITVQGDDVTLDLGQHTLTSTGTITVNANSFQPNITMKIRNGTLSRPAASNIVVGDSSPATMNVYDGAIIAGAASSGIVVGKNSNGQLNISDATTSTYTGAVADNPEANDGSAYGGSGLLTISQDGKWTIGQQLRVGRNGAGTVVMDGNAQLTVVGATKIYPYFNSYFFLYGGKLDTGSLDTSGDPSRFQWTGGTLNLRTSLEIDPAGALGGNLTLTGPMTLIANGGAHVSHGSNLNMGPGSFLTAAFANDGALTQTGGTVNAIGPNGMTGGGATNITGGTIFTLRLRQQSLLIGGTGLVWLGAQSPLATNIVTRVGTFAITDTGRIDLSDKRMVLSSLAIDVGTFNGTNYTGVTGLIQKGRNGGAWNGTGGIFTSQSNATTTGLTSIGVASVADAKGVGPGTSVVWSGEFVNSTNILIMYTYAGDANLDGKVTISDYGKIDFGIGIPGAGGWVNGDFNYDGKISISDYGLIDFTIGIQGPPFSTGADSGLSAVPEPSGVSALAIGALLLRRRRRPTRRASSAR